MNKRLLFLLLLVLLISSSIWHLNSQRLVEFVPKMRNPTTHIGATYTKRPELLADNNFVKNLVHLFDAYSIAYELKDERIYIKNEIMRDDEYVHNLTIKASKNRMPVIEVN